MPLDCCGMPAQPEWFNTTLWDQLHEVFATRGFRTLTASSVEIERPYG